MSRFLAVFLMFTAASTDADAGLFSPDPQVKAARVEVREARRESKDFDRLVRKFDRAVEKGKGAELAALDAELKAISRAELAALRARGVRTVEEPPRPIHPKHLPPGGVPPEEPGRPKMEALRDDLVALKRIDAPAADRKELNRKVHLLDDVSASLAARWERQERQLAKAKAAARG